METQRQTGLDLLRILSMLMIVTLHVLRHGGVLSAATATGPALFCWTLEALSYAGVNCFVLLSGYFLVRGTFRLRRLLRLWVQVLFYSIALYLIAVLCGAESFSVVRTVKFLLPTLLRKYWFFTAYFSLVLLSPFLNLLLLRLSKRQFQLLLAVLVGLFCVWPNLLAFSDLLPFGDGRSVCWFVTLYCVAAYLRLYPAEPPRTVCLAVWFGCSLVTAAEHFLYLRFLDGTGFAALFGDAASRLPTLFYANNSVPVLGAAVALFLFFRSVTVSRERVRKAAARVSALTFGVYLIHDHESVRKGLWGALHLSDYADSARIYWLTPVVCLAVFAVCLAIEQLRQLFFCPLERASFLDKPDERLRAYLER
jgi:surface polysaccharide O-acyltransferase-like enzyme